MRRRCRQLNRAVSEENGGRGVDAFQKMRGCLGWRVAESAHKKEPGMKMTRLIGSGATAMVIAVALSAVPHLTAVQQQNAATVAVDADDLGGVVTGPNGP